MEAGKTRIEPTEGWTADEEEPGPLSPAILWRKDWDALDNGTLVAVGSCRRGERPGGSPEKEKIPNLLLLFYLWLLLALPLSVHRLIEVTAEPHPPTGFGNYPSALHEGASEIMGMICKALLVLREISQRLAFVFLFISPFTISLISIQNSSGMAPGHTHKRHRQDTQGSLRMVGRIGFVGRGKTKPKMKNN